MINTNNVIKQFFFLFFFSSKERKGKIKRRNVYELCFKAFDQFYLFIKTQSIYESFESKRAYICIYIIYIYIDTRESNVKYMCMKNENFVMCTFMQSLNHCIYKHLKSTFESLRQHLFSFPVLWKCFPALADTDWTIG